MTAETELHRTGSYRYLPAIDPYSSGVAAEPGYEIVGLRFRDPPPVAEGFARLDAELAERALPPTAVVGIELRSPAPFAFGTFDEFNVTYRRLLEERGLLEGDVNPIARTNVAPVTSAPDEPVLFTAFLLQPSDGPGGTDFVVAGSGETPELSPDAIVARGDLSEEGMGRKVAFVLDEMCARLAGLGYGPDDPEVIDVYTAHYIPGLAATVAAALPAAHRWGLVGWLTRPPVEDIEFEMDLRRVSGWQVVGRGAGRDA